MKKTRDTKLTIVCPNSAKAIYLRYYLKSSEADCPTPMTRPNLTLPTTAPSSARIKNISNAEPRCTPSVFATVF